MELEDLDGSVASSADEESIETQTEDGGADEDIEGSLAEEEDGIKRPRMDKCFVEQEVQAIQAEVSSGRDADPFAEGRIRRIMEQVSIGADLSHEEHRKVQDLVAEFEDVFALSLSEVRPVDFIKHKLAIKEGAILLKQVSQKPLTKARRMWYIGILDEMEKAGICKWIVAEDVKCVSGTTLAPKDAGGGGMTREEIIQRANEVCQLAGLPNYYIRESALEVVTSTGEAETPGRQVEADSEAPRKWRVCHSYMTLNRNTQVPPFLQGNLYIKQQRMAGKRWTSVIDFAAGYYAVEMEPESVPYTAFYVEGKRILRILADAIQFDRRADYILRNGGHCP